MKISSTKYCLWILIIASFIASSLHSQHDTNDFRRGYWNSYEYGYNNGFDDGYNYAESNQQKNQKPGLESLPFGPICFGLSIGITCMLACNYFSSWQTDKKSTPEDTNIDDDALNRTTPLLFGKRVEILNNYLSIAEKINLNIPLIASMTSGYSRAKLEIFLKIVKRSAMHYNINFAVVKDIDAPIQTICPITMGHVDLAIDEMHGGSANFIPLDTKRIIKTAIHEAGHAIALIHTEQCILYSVSIINRASSIGRCISIYTNEQKSWTLENYKNSIIIALCGGLAEQIFGFDRSWYEGRYPAGAEQAFNECCKLAKNKNISKDLADLLAIPGAVGDMIHARQLALHIAKRYIELQPSEQNEEDKNGQIENHQCKILEECYQKALKLIQSHKSTIEKISQLLMRHDIISGDKVYALCNITRPLYAYEQ